MVNLNSLTKPYLIKLAKDCNIILNMKINKPELIKRIKNVKISENKLQSLINKYYDQYQNSKKPRSKAKKEIVNMISDKPRFYEEFQNLKEDYYKFKLKLSKEFENILSEITNLKHGIIKAIPNKKAHNSKISISELEKEIYLIYNQLKIRSHQPIKIEHIWEQIQKKNPNYKWETFSQQILRINSSNFHLEEGTAGRYINDPYNNKKYVYVIGN